MGDGESNWGGGGWRKVGPKNESEDPIVERDRKAPWGNEFAGGDNR